ncbi:hypothetical protein KR067_009074, partial [Drosophila pandora]
SAFIKEYLNLGHMFLVPPELHRNCPYFLPHHCVLKKDSTTTKLREVFDGTAVSTSGYSLNDILMAGPVIQPKLFHILLRFHSHPVALTGDICKMYHCVRMASSDSFLHSKEKVVGILGQISALLSKGEFQLQKWCSNIPSVLDGVPKEDRESY